MKKFKALAWSGLYIGISLGMQMVLSVIMVIAGTEILIVNGLAGNRDAYVEMMNQVKDYLTQGSGVLFITALLDIMLVVVFGLWYYFRENRYPFRPNYKKAFSKDHILSIVVLAVCGQLATEILIMGVSAVFPWMMKSYEKYNDLFQLDTAPPVLMLLLICVIGPIGEEILFRGMVYAKLRRAFSIWPAAIISGLLFGIYHMNWIQGIYASLAGIVFAIVYEKTQTIWGSCLLHMLFNGCTYVLEYGVTPLLPEGSVVVSSVHILVDVISVIVVILVVKHLCSRRREG